MKKIKSLIKKAYLAYQKADAISPALTGNWDKIDEWDKLDDQAIQLAKWCISCTIQEVQKKGLDASNVVSILHTPTLYRDWVTNLHCTKTV
jgi:hypothetical protein